MNSLDMTTKIPYKLLIILAVCAVAVYLFDANQRKQQEIDRLDNNVVVLMDSLHAYRVLDSLNAIQTKTLRLTVSEWQEAYKNEAALVKKLQADKRNLQSTINLQLQAIADFKSVLTPVVVYEVGGGITNDTIQCFDYSDKWLDVSGCIEHDTVSLHAVCREELFAVESVQRKRFLGVPLPVKWFGYKSRTLDVVSLNPNCKVISSTYKTIEK